MSISAGSGLVAAFTSGSAVSSCPNRIQFTNTTVGSGLTYSWNFGDGSSSTEASPVKGYATSGTYSVVLTANDGTCISTATTSVTAIAASTGPTAGFSINLTPQPLSGNNFSFFNTTQHLGFGWVTSYLWDFGDGTTSTNTHIYGKTYATIGVKTITLTAVSSIGCTDVVTQQVEISAATLANFTYTPNTCSSRQVAFTNASTGASSFSWNFGDATSAVTTQSPTHTYAADGSYNVVLTINGSVASTPQTVVVNTAPTAGFTKSLNTCNNQYSFTNTSVGSGLTYLWDFGDGTATSTATNPTHLYATAASVTVSLTATNPVGGCYQTSTQTFTSEIGNASALTVGLTVTAADYCSTTRLVNNTSTGTTGTTTYRVKVDAGSYTSVAAAAFPYTLPALSVGTHTIYLEASEGSCVSVASTIASVSSVSGNFNSVAAPCGHGATFTSTMASTSGVITYAWNFNLGEGSSTQANPSFTFSSGGSKSVTLTATATSGCQVIATNTVSVSSSSGPTATFNATEVNSSACNTGIQFTYTGTGGTHFVWTYGDGSVSPSSSSSSIMHSYAATGTYNTSVTATDASGCSISSGITPVNVTATAYPIPETGFTTPTAVQCFTGNSFYFFNNTQLNGWGWITGYTWDMGDGRRTLTTTTHVYDYTYAIPGTKTITLTATSNYGCTNTSSMNITVNPTPCAPMSQTQPPNGIYRGDYKLEGANGTKVTTGLNQNDISLNIALYPNPNNGNFILSLNEVTAKTGTISILDVLGREVYKNQLILKGKTEIEFTDLNLANGTYNLVLNTIENTSARKLFVVVK